jgi:hypothetical protein
VYPNIPGIKLYGDGMEPDHMAKYSLPIITDLSENFIQKKTFLNVLTPSHFSGCFWTRLGIYVHPCGFLFKKQILTKLSLDLARF